MAVDSQPEGSAQSVRLPFKEDIYGNPIYARVTWIAIPEAQTAHRPIVLIYHAGGLIAGNSDIVPEPQINHLLSAGFVVVLPNYRLLPQVTGKEAFGDSEDAFDWTVNDLPAIMSRTHDTHLDTTSIVAMGHSSGATMALNLASRKPIKAALALYPFLFISDPNTNPDAKAAPSNFKGLVEVKSEGAPIDWDFIAPKNKQVSEATLVLNSADVGQRERYASHIFTTGQWTKTMQPDGDFTAVDPMTRLNSSWPPVMLIHGADDNIPGRSVALMHRAQKAMLAAGVPEAELDIVDGGHLFDHVGGVGTTDLGPKWQSVQTGLDWLISRAHRA